MAATRTIEPAVRKIFRRRGRLGSVTATAVAVTGSASGTGSATGTGSASGTGSATGTGSAIATAAVPSAGVGVV
jgi:hypothetical protein